MIKKCVHIGVMVLVLTGLLFGISNSTLAQEKVIIRTIGGPDPHGYETAENDLFEKVYPWIKIEKTTVPYGIEQRLKLIASFRGARPYDMYIIDCVEVPEHANAGWALDVTERVAPEMKEGILPFAADGMVYQGRWYGLPSITEWKSFVYNARMLKEAGFTGPPKTWDEFVEQSKRLQAAGIVERYATAWSWAQKECLICDSVAIMASFGGQFFDEDLNPVFNSQAGAEALQWMIDSMYKHKISDQASLTFTESDVDALMEGGKIAFELRWGLPLVPLNDPKVSKVVDECKIGLFPAKTLATYPGYTVSGPMGWSIALDSPHKNEAWEYVEFRAGFVGAKRNAIKYGVFPGWISLYEDPSVTDAIPGLDVMLESGKQVVNRPRVPWYYKFSDALQLELHKAMTRVKSPENALDDAVTETLKIKREAE